MTSARDQSTDLAGAFARFERSAFRLETLDRYTVPDEAEPFRRYVSGEPQDPSWREPWAGFIREQVAAGKSMRRVHVVNEPLSTYLRFELTCGYPANVAAGEGIRIYVRRERQALDMFGDFWLFDDREVAIMDYGPDGEFLGASVTSKLTRSIDMHCEMRDLFWEHAVPLADYLREVGLD